MYAPENPYISTFNFNTSNLYDRSDVLSSYAVHSCSPCMEFGGYHIYIDHVYETCSFYCIYQNFDKSLVSQLHYGYGKIHHLCEFWDDSCKHN